VFIYCDGSPNAQQDRAVAQTRSVVANWQQRLNAQIIMRPDNLGLAHSLVGGITQLVQQFGRVIVIEDDLELSPDFIRYMLCALDRYRDDNAVFQISGHTFPSVGCVPDAHGSESRPMSLDEADTVKDDTFFLPVTSSWGWATWQRAWRSFDWQASGAIEQLTDPQLRRQFDLQDSYPFARMLEDRLAGRNQSWGILWRWSVFRQGGLVLYPRRSLVFNGGFDGSGVHCGRKGGHDEALRPLTLRFRFDSPIVFPPTITCDEEALDRLVQFHSQRHKKK